MLAVLVEEELDNAVALLERDGVPVWVLVTLEERDTVTELEEVFVAVEVTVDVSDTDIELEAVLEPV